MEYVIEVREGLEFVFDTEEVEEFHYDADRARALVDCHDPDSSLLVENVARWFLRARGAS